MTRVANTSIATTILCLLLHAAVPGQCPDHVKKNVIWGKPADLPFDGWVFFADYKAGGKAAVSTIRTWNKQLLKDQTGATFNVVNTVISTDGKWAVALSYKSGVVVRRDGYAVHKPIKNAAGQAMSLRKFIWYYNSPKENPAAGIYEVAYVYESDQAKAYAAILDVGSGTPVLGAERLIGEGLEGGPFGASLDEFAVAKDKFLLDKGAGTYVFTIPNGGLGTATLGDRYDVADNRNCSACIGQDGSCFAVNNQATNACMAGTHHGWPILDAKAPDAPKVGYTDWVLNTTNGALAYIWAPAVLDGITLPTDKTVEFWPNKFTNHPEYMIANNTSKIAAVNKYVYILHWPTNTWTPLCPAGEDAGWNSCFLDGVNSPVSVSFGTPSAGQVLATGTSVQVTASATSEAGAIASIVLSRGTTRLASSAGSTLVHTITSASAGAYDLTAVATDVAGNTRTATLSFTVRDASQFSAVRVSPPSAVVPTSQQVQFSAVAVDQFGTEIAGAYQPQWSVSGGGSIDPTSGLFTAGTQPNVDAVVTVSVSVGGVSKTATATVRVADYVRGLRYEYFEIAAPSTMPDFSTLTAVATGTAPTIDLSMRRRDDAFAVRFTGKISVTTEGQFTFYTSSDDGSMLKIDGAVVVDNNGNHAAQERSGTVTLTSGLHDIVIEYYENAGTETLQVSYAGPGIAKSSLPTDILLSLPPATPNLAHQSRNTVDQSVTPVIFAHPNGEVVIHHAPGVSGTVRLMDASGRMVAAQVLGRVSPTRAGTSTLRGGTYFVRVETRQGTAVRRIAIAR